MSIPVLDCRRFDDPSTRRDFARELGEGLEALGFVALEHHGVPHDLLRRAYTLADATFALPSAVKRRYESPQDGRQRGYTSLGVEHAKNQSTADLKEFWHVGRELGPAHPLHTSGAIPPNRYPSEISGFDQTFQDLFAALDGVVETMLRGIGLHLGWGEDALPAAVRNGNSVLRIIHYPPLPEQQDGHALRAAPHEDINLITILPVSTEPGLELLTRDGEWVPVDPPPGVMVCDTGDMMALLTGGRLPATTHRVVNPSRGADRSRYSMPFFCHPRPEVTLSPPGTQGGPTAGEFLMERLRDIGVAG